MSERVVAVQTLADLGAHVGERVDVFAVLRECVERTTKKGQPYCALRLADVDAAAGAMIWSDRGEALAAARGLAPGTIAKIRADVTLYEGAPQLTVLQLRATTEEDDFDPRQLYGDAPAWLAERTCKTLVFDIETVPAHALRDMPPTIVKSLTKEAERRELDEAAVMGLSPYFGKVVSLAFGDGELPPGEQAITVLAVPPDDGDRDWPDWVVPLTERELLASFWMLASAAETVVTYNGRGFDVPFLVGRSLVHGIPARVDLLSGRWNLRPHLDLFDVLGQRGRGPANLDVICWALDISSPKGTMDGSMVAPAYAKGEIVRIAEYNREDVRATTAVYQAVRDHVLRFRNDY